MCKLFGRISVIPVSPLKTLQSGQIPKVCSGQAPLHTVRLFHLAASRWKILLYYINYYS